MKGRVIQKVKMARDQAATLADGLNESIRLSWKHFKYMERIGVWSIDISKQEQVLKQGLMHRSTLKNWKEGGR